MLRSPLRKRVAQARAAQDVGEQSPPLPLAAPQAEHVDEQIVGLRHLRDRRVDHGDHASDLGQRSRRDVGTAVGGGNRDAEEPAPIEHRELSKRRCA